MLEPFTKNSEMPNSSYNPYSVSIQLNKDWTAIPHLQLVSSLNPEPLEVNMADCNQFESSPRISTGIKIHR